jgi:hypothetical protein
MFHLGLDLGQRRDYSAIVVGEHVPQRRAYQGELFGWLAVRHVERAPLGTPYPRVVERVREIVQCGEVSGDCVVTVDGTGVGAPVVEMLRGAGLGCGIKAVVITGGEKEHAMAGMGGETWSVPKRDLMAGVQVMLEEGELRIAKGLRNTGALVRELLDVRASYGRGGGGGRLRLGADGHGEHDDLVIALALACWSAKRKKSGFGVRRLPGI